MLWSVAKYRNLRIYEDYIKGLSIFYKGGANNVMATEICPVLVILDEMRTQEEVEEVQPDVILLVSAEMKTKYQEARSGVSRAEGTDEDLSALLENKM
ncbi:hypothetical protein ACRRTK_013220 [Alexandromys fortis]